VPWNALKQMIVGRGEDDVPATALGEGKYIGLESLRKAGPLFQKGTLLVLKKPQKAYLHGVNADSDLPEDYIDPGSDSRSFLRKGTKLTVLKEGIAKMWLPPTGNIAMRYIKALTTVGDGEYEEFEKRPVNSGEPLYCSILVNPEVTYESIKEYVNIFEGTQGNTKKDRKYRLEETETLSKKIIGEVMPTKFLKGLW